MIPGAGTVQFLQADFLQAYIDLSPASLLEGGCGDSGKARAGAEHYPLFLPVLFPTAFQCSGDAALSSLPRSAFTPHCLSSGIGVGRPILQVGSGGKEPPSQES